MKKIYKHSAKDQIIQPKENHANSLLTETDSLVTKSLYNPIPHATQQ